MVYFVREMWQYLDQVATFISNIGEVLRKMPSSEKGLVRQGLSSATRRYSSSHKRARTPRTQSKAMPFITGDDGMLLPGVYNITTSCHVTCHVVTNYCRGSPLLQWWSPSTAASLLWGFLWSTSGCLQQREANGYFCEDSSSPPGMRWKQQNRLFNEQPTSYISPCRKQTTVLLKIWPF